MSGPRHCSRLAHIAEQARVAKVWKAANEKPYSGNPDEITCSNAGQDAQDKAGALGFSQTTASSTFRNSPMTGRTIGDVSSALRSGAIKRGVLPVDVISRGGNSLIMNTRSSLALMRRDVSRADWAINDVTGDASMENVLTGRLASNGLTDVGTDMLRITGAGQWASWLG